ncbi:uncharacterized protein B0T23DRAFT_86631 [Neurospora hispaniola]|uniref:Uncharacterized protein n=1 Tax=Neurospora hispaniola TaxID=588809 RepID=A0AAJ0IDC1_9PEZI|nr:hypothetical protein B0T23DRAFT_86631 [Neurospora hispaniola]
MSRFGFPRRASCEIRSASCRGYQSALVQSGRIIFCRRLDEEQMLVWPSFPQLGVAGTRIAHQALPLPPQCLAGKVTLTETLAFTSKGSCPIASVRQKRSHVLAARVFPFARGTLPYYTMVMGGLSSWLLSPPLPTSIFPCHCLQPAMTINQRPEVRRCRGSCLLLSLSVFHDRRLVGKTGRLLCV